MKRVTDFGTPGPGEYVFQLDDGTHVLARVRRLRSRPGNIGLAVRVCRLMATGEPETVNGEVVWTKPRTSSMSLAALTQAGGNVRQEVAEAIHRTAEKLVGEIEVTKSAMGAITDIPMEDAT